MPNSKPSRSISPTVRALFAHLDRDGRNQTHVAYEIEASPSQVNGWRRGANMPGIFNCERLADALGLEIIVREKQP